MDENRIFHQTSLVIPGSILIQHHLCVLSSHKTTEENLQHHEPDTMGPADYLPDERLALS